MRPSAPGAADDLWPDVFAAAPAADEVSTIVPAPDAPAALADIPPAVGETAAEAVTDAGLPLAAAREWEPAVVDVPASTTSIDDIHAAILASVSVDLEPIAEPGARARARARPVAAISWSSPSGADHDRPGTALARRADSKAALLDGDAARAATRSSPKRAEPTIRRRSWSRSSRAAAVVDEPAVPAFTLTPFDATGADAVDADAAEPPQDADALWAAAAPELGLDVAPLLELDGVDDPGDEDAPPATTAVVLPWPSHEPKAAEPAAR